MTSVDERQFLTVADEDGAPDGRRIAFVARSGAADASHPGVVWLGGFRSDMESGKAVALDRWAQRTGRAMLRFDYSGHGASEGRFVHGTIGRWSADALAAIRHASVGPQILVGSSMGAWIALLAARRLAEAGEDGRIAGMVLIAPAVDFTEALLRPRLPPEARDALAREGVWLRPSPHGEPIPITRALLDDGQRHLLLGTSIRAYGPVHILQGMSDPDVPWEHAMRLVEHLPLDPVTVTLIKDGDHRLSRDEDIARLISAVEGLV